MDNIINNETLKRAVELYEQKRLSEYDKLESFTPSENFEKNMNKLIKSQSNYYYKLTRTKVRKVVTVFAAAVVIIASMMSVTAIRETILGFFILHTSEVDVIKYGNQGSYPETIKSAFTPSYIPKGYTLEDKTSDSTSRELYYVKGDNYIDFQQFTKGEYSSASDGEFSAPEKINDNGQNYIIRTSDDNTVMLVWEKSGYVFEMTGFESKEEMFKIARSIEAEKEGER